MCFSSAFGVVMVRTQALVIVRRPEVSAEAHRLDVVHYSGSVIALSAQRIELEEAIAILAPAMCVVAMLNDTSLVHLLALARLRHPWHRVCL